MRRKAAVDTVASPLAQATAYGTVLSRAALAEEFRLSSTPIRDALMRLEEEKLVEVFPQHATLVSPIDLSPIRFPCSPEWWRSNEALQAEAQAPQAPREQRHQAAGNIPALRSSGLFSAGVRFSTASHMPVDTAQWRASDSTSTSRSSRSVRAM